MYKQWSVSNITAVNKTKLVKLDNFRGFVGELEFIKLGTAASLGFLNIFNQSLFRKNHPFQQKDAGL